MLISIPDVLRSNEVEHCRRVLAQANWGDGRITAGFQSATVKENDQLVEAGAEARELGRLIVDALYANPLFISAALPRKIFPPLFNRYREGQHFGNHIDNAIRVVPNSGFRIRTDLSATLFIADPDSYDGGELVIEDTYGEQAVKLPAGHMVLYPSTSIHHVRPVTRGARIASFFWIESMVRDDAERRLLYELDCAIQSIGPELPDHPALVRFTGIYHNLVRRWADA